MKSDLTKKAIAGDEYQLRETLGNLLKASDELASAIELSSGRFDTGLLDDIAPSKRELVLAANSARKILNAGASTKSDITKNAIAANIEDRSAAIDFFSAEPASRLIASVTRPAMSWQV